VKVRVFGGVAGSKPIETVGRVTFAVAPVVEGKPAYADAIFVTAGDDGSYAVSLAAGKYFLNAIGPDANGENSASRVMFISIPARMTGHPEVSGSPVNLTENALLVHWRPSR
jgi:hypothetical protein